MGIQILWGLLLLSLLVIAHELGHFVFAKLFDVKVCEFSIFMGPKIFGFKKGETEYTLRLIPIGGYVSMEGEDEDSDDERAFNKKSVWKRIVIIAAGPVVNVLIAIIAFIVVVSSSGVATTQITKLDESGSMYESGMQAGDIIRKVDGRSVLSLQEFSLFSVATKEGVEIPIEVQRGEETLIFNVTPQIIEKHYKYIIGYSYKEDADKCIVDSIEKGYPAEKAGLKVGDIIIEFNGKPITKPKDFTEYMKENGDSEVNLVVERDGARVELNGIIPEKKEVPEETSIGTAYFKRINPQGLQVVNYALRESFSTARVVGYSLAFLVTGKIGVNNMSGPVGIVTTIGEVVEQGSDAREKFLSFMFLLGLISMNLGMMNMVLFPALDGSKIILYIIEGIRRKAISKEVEGRMNFVGFIVLIGLMIFATWNDIVRLIGG